MQIYTFKDEKSLVQEIKKLKLERVKTKDMTVIGKERPSAEFKQYKDIEFVKGDGSIWEKFLGKLYNKNSEELISRRFDFDLEEYNIYHEALKKGEIILVVKNFEENNSNNKMSNYKKEENTDAKNSSKDEEFLEILDDYGLNSELSFTEKENNKTK
ncbi:MAG TPA: general stress protein [Candidatus Nosocomiicoccus stercorigallinarum]|nr:general stress protein [Candidatus Nosocomiicoccus stercorigallinarum]